MTKTFLSILFFICTIALSAQHYPVAAKEVNSCLYGLKDSTGKWVMEPRYTSIEHFNWRKQAKVTLGNYYGVIDMSGKEILAPVYSEIKNPFAEFIDTRFSSISEKNSKEFHLLVSYWNIRTKEGWGIADNNGKIILEPEQISVSYFYEGIAIFKTKQGRYGMVSANEITGYFPEGASWNEQEPVCIGRNRFRIFTGTRKENNIRWGICDEKGNMILPFADWYIGYESAGINAATVYTNEGIAFYDLNGKPASGSVYKKTVPDKQFYHYIPNPPFLRIKNKNGTGMVGENAKELIPPVYDSIQIFRIGSYMLKTDSFMFLAYKKNNCQIYDLTGKAIFKKPFEDLLQTKTSTIGGRAENTCFAGKTNGKWGCYSYSGNTILDPVYDTVFDQDKNSIFWSRKEVRVIYVIPETGFISLKDYKTDSAEQIYNFYTSNLYYEYPKNEYLGKIWRRDYYEDTLADTAYQYMKLLSCEFGFKEMEIRQTVSPDSLRYIFRLPHGYGFAEEFRRKPHNFNVGYEYLVEYFPGKTPQIQNIWDTYSDKQFSYYHIGNNKKSLIRNDGFLIYDSLPGYRNGYQVVSKNNTILFEVISTGGKHGFMNLQKELVIDTGWYSIYMSESDTVWVKTKPIGTCENSWNLYSLSQQKLLLNENEEFRITFPFSAKRLAIAESGNRKGLYNCSKMKYIIPPVYDEIIPMDQHGDFYSVTTPYGNSGIIDKDGKEIADTVWNKMIGVIPNMYSVYGDSSEFYGEKKFLYILQNGKKKMVFDQNSLHPYDKFIDSLIQSVRKLPKEMSWYGHQESYAVYADSTIVFEPWMNKLLADSIFLSPLAGDFRYNYRMDEDYYYRNEADEYSYQCLEYEESFYQFSSAGETFRNVISYTSPSCLSVFRQNENNYNKQLYYLNYWKSGKDIQIIPLDFLFKNNLWKAIVIDTLLKHLDAHPEINSPCVNVSKMTALLQNRFLISAEGLCLYPDWHLQNEWRQPIYEIEIPWDKLKPYLKPEIAAKIGL